MQSEPHLPPASTSTLAGMVEVFHHHCASCVNQWCTAKPQAGTSCDLTTCPLGCGAAFHSCKMAEHRLLCPLESVPCLNSGFGCPAVLARRRMPTHLEVCPAGLVCCTMEWKSPVSCHTSQLSRHHRREEQPEQLDVVLALQEEHMLLEALKAMAPPTERQLVAIGTKECGEAHLDSSQPSPEASSSSPQHLTLTSPGVAMPLLGLAPPPTPGSAKERIANGINGLNTEDYGQLYKATLETARSLTAALDVFHAGDPSECTTPPHAHRGGSHRSLTTSTCHFGAQFPCELPHPGATGSTACHGQDQLDTNGGPPPQQENFKEQCLAPKGKPPDASLCVAQRSGVGPFTCAADQWGPTPNGSHPTSPLATEDRAVDTSDLEREAEEEPRCTVEMDPVAAALLFRLEAFRKCGWISDRVCVNGGLVDIGTQIFTFPAALLVTDTGVGAVASSSAWDQGAPLCTLNLGLALESLKAEVPHMHSLPFQPCCQLHLQHTFSFTCGQSFRRDQFSSHWANVHADIHAGRSGWIEHCCPLACYGCTFSQRRLCPAGPRGTAGEARLVHDGLRSFGVQQCLPAGPIDGPPLRGGLPLPQFTGLPIEILWYIVGFLDSFSLCQLSVVSRGMREICARLLETRGVVELQWVRRQGLPPHATVSWHVKNKVWRFSTAFSSVLRWRFGELPSMSDHLRTCRYNTPEPKTEPVALPAVCMPHGSSWQSLLRPVNERPCTPPCLCHHNS